MDFESYVAKLNQFLEENPQAGSMPIFNMHAIQEISIKKVPWVCEKDPETGAIVEVQETCDMVYIK